MNNAKKELSSTSRGMKIVSIFAYASDTVEVSALLPAWLEATDPSSQTVGFLDALVLARSSFANSRASRRSNRFREWQYAFLSEPRQLLSRLFKCWSNRAYVRHLYLKSA
eukprot:Gb_27213 [translate_table: standard]